MLVDLGNAGVDRQNHIRKKIVHHTEDNGASRSHDLDLGKSELGQKGVEKTAVVKDRH